MNKKILTISGIVVLLLILVAGFYFLSTKSKTSTSTKESTETIVLNLSPEDIGLRLVTSSDKKKVKIVIDNVSNIKDFSYEITYDADIPASELAAGEEGGKVERGFSGEEIIKSGQTSYESKYLDLGSCSRNVCRYDTGVTEVKIMMKVVKKDEKIYKVEDSIKL